jgi:hypothetical protein
VVHEAGEDLAVGRGEAHDAHVSGRPGEKLGADAGGRAVGQEEDVVGGGGGDGEEGAEVDVASAQAEFLRAAEAAGGGVGGEEGDVVVPELADEELEGAGADDLEPAAGGETGGRIDDEGDAAGPGGVGDEGGAGETGDEEGEGEGLEEELPAPGGAAEGPEGRVALRDELPEEEAGDHGADGGLAPEAEDGEEKEGEEAPEGGGRLEDHSSTPASRR